MILEKLLIANYRSCKRLSLDFNSNTPNIFIGLNDCGKSTILSAIDLLLGIGKYSSLSEGNYKSDLSNSPLSIDEFNLFIEKEGVPKLNYSPKETIVIGKLSYTNEELELFKELTLSNSLAWAIESTEDNVIWIAKSYNELSNQFYLLTNDDVDKNRLWEKTATDLNKILKEWEVSNEDVKNENGKGRFSNLEKIRAAYKKKEELHPYWTWYKTGKSDKDVFPEFNYFDWNCSFEDINSLANSIMKEHIEVQLKPLKKKALTAANEAEQEINKKFGELSDVIKSVAKGVENINSKVHFDVKEKISDIMVQKTNSDGYIHLENQGEGLKRQIWFSLIKSKAENSKEENVNQFIWAFDEPETHLFPGAQREFFDILVRISKSNVQTFISTHSTVFIDKSSLDRISSVSQEDEGYTRVDKCVDVSSIYSSLNVKNSDFLFFDKFLIVEGDTEQYLIPRLFELYTKSTLLERNVQLINIQGKDKWTMNKALIDKIMKGFKKSDEQVIYLFDNDMSYEIGEAVKTENMFFVGDQDIEDALGAELWHLILSDYYQDEIEISIQEIEELITSVPKKSKATANQKFYKLVDGLIKSKWIESGKEIDELKRIPSKGNESSDFILDKLNDAEMIPSKIIEAFEKVLS